MITELDRLEIQAQALNPFTEKLLIRAGVKPGMRVLDVGCGAGDVTFLVSKIVGQGGMVIGADSSRECIARARDRRRSSNVFFSCCAIETYEPSLCFDAIVGRLILMHLDNPAGAVRQLSKLGRLLVFQEAAGEGVVHMGFKLKETFREAGLIPRTWTDHLDIPECKTPILVGAWATT